MKIDFNNINEVDLPMLDIHLVKNLKNDIEEVSQKISKSNYFKQEGDALMQTMELLASKVSALSNIYGMMVIKYATIFLAIGETINNSNMDIDTFMNTIQNMNNNSENMDIIRNNIKIIKESEKYAEIAYALDDRGLYACTAMGMVRWLYRKYDDAISIYNKAIENNSNDYLAYQMRGIAYRQLGQNEKAINDFNLSLQYADDSQKEYITKLINEMKSEKQAKQNISESISNKKKGRELDI